MCVGGCAGGDSGGGVSCKQPIDFTLCKVGEGFDLIESIATTLLAVWRFRKFTESRWLTVGTSCRTLVAAVILGFDDLFREIQQDCSSE